MNQSPHCRTRPQKIRRRKRVSSAIITRTPVKKRLFPQQSGDSSTNKEELFADSESNASLSGGDSSLALQTKKLVILKCGDFVIANVHTAAGKCKKCIGKLVSGLDKDKDFEISFLERSRKIKIYEIFFNLDWVIHCTPLSPTPSISLTLLPNLPSHYHFYLYNPHAQYIFPCSVSLPSQSVQLFFTFFCSNLVYKSSYACPFAIATAFFALLFFSLYIFLVFSSPICPMLSLPLSFLLCSPELPHSTTMSPCLLFVSQMSLPVQFQLFFLAFLLFCPTHQVIHPCLP